MVAEIRILIAKKAQLVKIATTSATWQAVPIKKRKYTVKVATGNVWHAGTDANVWMVMEGDLGVTEQIGLKTSDKLNKFEQNQVDTFQLNIADIGHVHKLSIGHDGSGLMSGWFVHNIVVEYTDDDSPRVIEFVADRWLDSKKADGKLFMHLEATTADSYRPA